MGDSITGLPLKMVGEDGNAFAILGRAHQVLRRAGMGDRIAEFDKEAMSGNYDNLLNICMKWFEVDAEVEDPAICSECGEVLTEENMWSEETCKKCAKKLGLDEDSK